MAETTLKTVEAVAGQWDANLDAVRVEGNVIRGLKCGVFAPDLADGDVYYKIAGAAFIDEEASAGRHVITVDVIDEHFNRIQGAKVYHGWPVERFPEYDDRVQLTIFGSVLAEWGLYANFDAWRVPGPYWVQCADGKSDTFWGAGLPWNRHVCFAVVFQRTVYQAQPTGTLEELLIAAGDKAQVIQFNPRAALQRTIFAAGFVPNSPEYNVEKDGHTYVAQRSEQMDSRDVRYYYCPVDDYNKVNFVVRPGGPDGK